MARKHEIGVGLLLIGAAAMLAFMAFKVGALRGLGDPVQVDAVFEDSAGLQVGASVRVAGVEVGRVSSLDVDFDKAVVGLALERDADIREDVVVVLRARSVLGEKYVELQPQSRDAPLLESGAVLTDTKGSLEIDELVTALKPFVQESEKLQPDAVEEVLGPIVAVVREDPEAPQRMWADLEGILANLNEASAQAPELITESRQTLAEVRQVSREARSTMEEAQALVDRGELLLDKAEPMVEDLQTASAELPQLTEDAQLTLTEARTLLEELQGSSARLDGLLENFEDLDIAEIERLMREEGVKVRLIERRGED
ncbi:MAG: MlaD family protein [Myxococcota bacterium]|nr:MlaD family protein [Myxococcota bacterium]